MDGRILEMSVRRTKFADRLAQTGPRTPLDRIDRTRGPLRDQIYRMIRRMILTGEFAPGLVIDEKAIALKLGVSRTPVREALKKLSDENLVDVKAQSATAIASIDRKLIHEAFLIRRALEVESIGIAAARMTEQHEERLEDLYLLHTHAIERRRYVDAIARDDAFHSYISEISDLPHLWQAIEISKAQLDRCRFLTVPRPGQAEATLVQHRNIMKALIKKDEALARQMMGEHLEMAYNGIVAFLETMTGGATP
jgi:DNA-binding GntR family transcriptional regulator